MPTGRETPPPSSGGVGIIFTTEYLLVSWVLFLRDGTFLSVDGTPESETLARLFRHKVLRMLLEEGVLAEGVVRNLLAGPTRDSART